jgi:hypothetical protein
VRLDAEVQVTVGLTVIPGPVTLAQRAALGEFYCPCHGFHRHDAGALFCPAEWSLGLGSESRS